MIDPEELPFTSDEIFRAACVFLPQHTARNMADHLADCAPDLLRGRARRRRSWKKAGIINAEEVPLHGWVYPEELLPALASLSSDLARRVAELRDRLAIRPRSSEVQSS